MWLRRILSFYAYTEIQSENVGIAVIIAHLTWHFANTCGHFDFDDSAALGDGQLSCQFQLRVPPVRTLHYNE